MEPFFFISATRGKFSEDIANRFTFFTGGSVKSGFDISATRGRFSVDILLRSTGGVSMGEWSGRDKDATLGKFFDEGKLLYD